jgi:VWFA-related protein
VTPRFPRFPGLLLATALAAIPQAPATDIPAVRFLLPPPHRPVAGETRIALEVRTPAGSRIVRVDLYVDGQRLASLERAPYEVVWNAGPEFLPHILRAVATDDAGRTAEAVLETPPLRVGQREAVVLVNLHISVTDPRGKPVTDLRREEFTVYEDGIPQEVSVFSAARQRLTAALLLDASNSMGTGQRMRIARKAAIEFLRNTGPDDRVLVLSFQDSVREIQPPTADRKLLEAAIESIEPSGGTALYDAVVSAAQRLRGIEGKKAMVLLSDGRDQALRETAPGSLHLYEEALEAAVRSEAAVYAIGLGAHLDRETDLEQRRTLQEILEGFAERTGGRFYNPERPGQLSGVYDQIAEDLSRQYTLAYTPSNTARDGAWRTIRVEVARPTLRVLTRPGYFAPSR